MEGYLTLVDIDVNIRSLQGQDRYNVQGRFCNIDWKLQQRNPSTVPMFRDLQASSAMCQGTLLTVDLWDIVRKAKAFDQAVSNVTTTTTTTTSSSLGFKGGKHFQIASIPPTGVVFHETRCGSTLAANLLASFSPLHTRVYSESGPPISAFKACSFPSASDAGYDCNPTLHQQLIRDVFYMMGRTTQVERPQYVFYKFQSISTHHISTFTKVFPDVPWVFLYRDSVEVMMSHLRGDSWSVMGANPPVCARMYGSAYQPPITKELIEYQEKKVEELTKPEYCAAHLVCILLGIIICIGCCALASAISKINGKACRYIVKCNRMLRMGMYLLYILTRLVLFYFVQLRCVSHWPICFGFADLACFLFFLLLLFKGWFGRSCHP